MSAEKTRGDSDRAGSVTIRLDARGDENAFGFSLNYDPNRLRFVGAKLNRKLSRAAFLVNSKQAARGRIGILLALPAGERLAAGAQSLMTIHFSDVVDLSPNDAQVRFGDEPVTRGIADVNAESPDAIFLEPDISLNTPTLFNSSSLW
ncbi:MAG: cohesin domain-containing protein [Blastocatellia bacterium]